MRDQTDYDFKPAALVMDISRIYVNLGKCDEFCLAVSQDGRSYSPSLFQQAEYVLGMFSILILNVFMTCLSLFVFDGDFGGFHSANWWGHAVS